MTAHASKRATRGLEYIASVGMARGLAKVGRASFCLMLLFSLAVISLQAKAAVLTSNTTGRLYFDLSKPPLGVALGIVSPGVIGPVFDVIPTPPFYNMNIQLYFSAADGLDPAEGFSFQVFDSAGNEASRIVRLDSPWSEAEYGIEFGFGGREPLGKFQWLNTLDGYVEITGITGSFGIDRFLVLAAQDSGDLIATGWILGDSIEVMAAPVPEPSTYALMALGLGAVAYRARRRKSVTVA